MSMKNFDFETLDVYQVSIKHIIVTEQVLADLPKGKSYIADQLRRAASSVTLNIAEGAGEYCRNEKARFYRIAKRSATESASILNIINVLNLASNSLTNQARDYLIRVVSMLTKMIKQATDT